MKEQITRWVIGHRIQPMVVSGDYDLALGETPGNVPGPPPHYHSKLNEVFLITEGEMEFMVNGEIQVLRAGESVDLPPNTVHTFANKTDRPCKWVNIHSPKGFVSFFEEFGIPDNEENAIGRSVDEALIGQVIQRAADFDMHIQLP